MKNKKIYYIENDNYLTIKRGILTKIFDGEYNCKIATIREPVDKYRPEHFHNIPLYNIKEFVEKDEIDFLNDLAEKIHDRLEDLWCELKEVNKT